MTKTTKAKADRLKERRSCLRTRRASAGRRYRSNGKTEEARIKGGPACAIKCFGGRRYKTNGKTKGNDDGKAIAKWSVE